jgi:hypothetical protein
MDDFVCFGSKSRMAMEPRFFRLAGEKTEFLSKSLLFLERSSFPVLRKTTPQLK